jgi:hypothetical protein
MLDVPERSETSIPPSVFCIVTLKRFPGQPRPPCRIFVMYVCIMYHIEINHGSLSGLVQTLSEKQCPPYRAIAGSDVSHMMGDAIIVA